MQDRESEIRDTIHDLNNALATVLGSAELIVAASEEGSQTARDAESIRIAAIRARDLVHRLRDCIGRG